jgi:hypothetical protein
MIVCSRYDGVQGRAHLTASMIASGPITRRGALPTRTSTWTTDVTIRDPGGVDSCLPLAEFGFCAEPILPVAPVLSTAFIEKLECPSLNLPMVIAALEL